MQRWLTLLVVAGLAALGLAAAIDALRGEEQLRRSDSRQPTVPGLADQPEPAIRQLREAELTGVLTYADDECRLHAVSLPELQAVRAPTFEMCRPATASGGVGAVDGDVVWAGLGYGSSQVVVSKEQLSRAIRIAFGSPADNTSESFRAVQAVSAGQSRYVVLADSTYSPRERVVALLQGTEALLVHPRWEVRDARFIRSSPQGGYYAFVGMEQDGVRVFTRGGRPLTLPEGIDAPQTVAWSPDERWTALATEHSVYVFSTERPQEVVIRIPLVVRDLDWSASALADTR